MTLIKIISICDDTVMIKRAKNKYNYFKNKIANIKEYNINVIKNITNECIDHNISCGGAADILITAIFLNKIKRKFS